MAKILGKTHKSKVLGPDTHSVSLNRSLLGTVSSVFPSPYPGLSKSIVMPLFVLIRWPCHLNNKKLGLESERNSVMRDGTVYSV